MFDSRWTIPVALSLLDRGDTNLDEYGALIEQDRGYGVQCVAAHGAIEPGGTCRDGHYYNVFPVAVPLVAAPLVFTLRKVAPLLAPVLSKVPGGGPVRAAFLAGDFLNSRPLVEVVIASFFVALTTVLMFFIGRIFLPDPYSAFLALIFAFATSAWSTASRALWQHGPSMLMLSVTLYLLIRAERAPWLIPYAAIPVALAYLLRPTNSLFAVLVTIYVARRYRRQLLPYLLLAVPIGAAFLIYNESIYRKPLPPYFSMRPPLPALPVFEALAGSLVSPSRGLFVYTPLFFFSILGMIEARRARWLTPLSGYLIAVIVCNWLLMGIYFRFWWGGHSYGPRLLSDLAPLLVFFLIPPLVEWRQAGRPLKPALLFAAMLAVSGFIHSRGATRLEVYDWNTTPDNVDRHTARLWDWRDPQFLRGLRR
jgi:hypothetical protein